MGTFGPEIWSGASTPGGQAELVRQIETARPVYVVYDESEWPDTDGVAWMDRAHDVNRYKDRLYASPASWCPAFGTFMDSG